MSVEQKMESFQVPHECSDAINVNVNISFIIITIIIIY